MNLGLSTFATWRAVFPVQAGGRFVAAGTHCGNGSSFLPQCHTQLAMAALEMEREKVFY